MPLPDLSDEKVFPDVIKVKALFSQDVKWRLVEEFGPNCYSETKDGRLLFATDYTDMDNLIAWILTFGEKAEVSEPEAMHRRILDIAGKMNQIYGGDRQDEI